MKTEHSIVRGGASEKLRCPHCATDRKVLIRVLIEGIMSTHICNSCARQLNKMFVTAIKLSAIGSGARMHKTRNDK